MRCLTWHQLINRYLWFNWNIPTTWLSQVTKQASHQKLPASETCVILKAFPKVHLRSRCSKSFQMAGSLWQRNLTGFFLRDGSCHESPTDCAGSSCSRRLSQAGGSYQCSGFRFRVSPTHNGQLDSKKRINNLCLQVRETALTAQNLSKTSISSNYSWINYGARRCWILWFITS